MTKNYCDKCKKEAKNNKHVRILITGEIFGKYYSDFIHLCEDCFKKYDSEISKFISIESRTTTA